MWFITNRRRSLVLVVSPLSFYEQEAEERPAPALPLPIAGAASGENAFQQGGPGTWCHNR